ncbi:hypothetical protein Pyn_08192 [Prunus yedoensis var. nudiflora]|uniref:Uncharacterized protein n=1 Tax=Prunus yedoensis var. nudiflora TaxID=2094558 RepID=A0A314Y7A8_PRUYE|nr:hypothetical protein Pyn_08192 [Prunus yedoensis var. nudiflora]
MEGPSPSATEPGSQDSHNAFVWDESSQLYFHAGSGFYHDPTASWYYSTRDGLYYKFEDGNYVLLPSHQADNLETCETRVTASENPIQRELFAHESEYIETVPQEPIGISGTQSAAVAVMLEDTLIDLYLSGYSNLEANAADDMTVFPETDVEFGSNGLF